MLDEMFDVYLHTGKAINNELDNYAEVTSAYYTYFYVDNIPIISANFRIVC